jgi:hypothetical protein
MIKRDPQSEFGIAQVSGSATTQLDERPCIGTEFPECSFVAILGEPKGAGQLCPAVGAAFDQLPNKWAPFGQSHGIDADAPCHDLDPFQGIGSASDEEPPINVAPCHRWWGRTNLDSRRPLAIW